MTDYTVIVRSHGLDLKLKNGVRHLGLRWPYGHRPSDWRTFTYIFLNFVIYKFSRINVRVVSLHCYSYKPKFLSYLRYWLLSFHIVTFLYLINFISEIWTLISFTLYISVRLVNWILTLLRLCPRHGFMLIELCVAPIHLRSILVAVFADKYHSTTLKGRHQ